MEVNFDTAKCAEWEWRRRAKAEALRVAELEAQLEYAQKLLAAFMQRETKAEQRQQQALVELWIAS